MVKVICCQSQSGRILLCYDTHCSVALKPQLLQDFDLQLWQKNRLCEQSVLPTVRKWVFRNLGGIKLMKLFS